jgi:hypothetical protein
VFDEFDRHRDAAWLEVRGVAGVGDDGVGRVGELGGGPAALFDRRIGVQLAGLNEDGTSGSGRPCSGEPAVGSAGQSRHFGPASMSVPSQA